MEVIEQVEVTREVPMEVVREVERIKELVREVPIEVIREKVTPPPYRLLLEADLLPHRACVGAAARGGESACPW